MGTPSGIAVGTGLLVSIGDSPVWDGIVCFCGLFGGGRQVGNACLFLGGIGETGSPEGMAAPGGIGVGDGILCFRRGMARMVGELENFFFDIPIFRGDWHSYSQFLGYSQKNCGSPLGEWMARSIPTPPIPQPG